MLEGLVDCAHALGMVLGAAAKAESDTKRCLGLVEAFQKSFLAVRMGIRRPAVDLGLGCRSHHPSSGPGRRQRRVEAV